jgi:hypothetical protein
MTNMFTKRATVPTTEPQTESTAEPKQSPWDIFRSRGKTSQSSHVEVGNPSFTDLAKKVEALNDKLEQLTSESKQQIDALIEQHARTSQVHIVRTVADELKRLKIVERLEAGETNVGRLNLRTREVLDKIMDELEKIRMTLRPLLEVINTHDESIIDIKKSLLVLMPKKTTKKDPPAAEETVKHTAEPPAAEEPVKHTAEPLRNF